MLKIMKNSRFFTNFKRGCHKFLNYATTDQRKQRPTKQPQCGPLHSALIHSNAQKKNDIMNHDIQHHITLLY